MLPQYSGTLADVVSQRSISRLISAVDALEEASVVLLGRNAKSWTLEQATTMSA